MIVSIRLCGRWYRRNIYSDIHLLSIFLPVFLFKLLTFLPSYLSIFYLSISFCVFLSIYKSTFVSIIILTGLNNHSLNNYKKLRKDNRKKSTETTTQISLHSANGHAWIAFCKALLKWKWHKVVAYTKKVISYFGISSQKCYKGHQITSVTVPL